MRGDGILKALQLLGWVWVYAHTHTLRIRACTCIRTALIFSSAGVWGGAILMGHFTPRPMSSPPVSPPILNCGFRGFRTHAAPLGRPNHSLHFTCAHNCPTRFGEPEARTHAPPPRAYALASPSPSAPRHRRPPTAPGEAPTADRPRRAEWSGCGEQLLQPMPQEGIQGGTTTRPAPGVRRKAYPEQRPLETR